jgi:hypothetical protein
MIILQGWLDVCSIFSWFYHTIFKVLTTDFISKMHQNAPFCILLKKHFSEGGSKAPQIPHTAFSLSRVGMYASLVILSLTLYEKHLWPKKHVTTSPFLVICQWVASDMESFSILFSVSKVFRKYRTLTFLQNIKSSCHLQAVRNTGACYDFFFLSRLLCTEWQKFNLFVKSGKEIRVTQIFIL